MSEKSTKSPERDMRDVGSPKARLLKNQRSRHDSVASRTRHDSVLSGRSIGSGSLHRRLSYRRQSSLGLPHCDSFKSMILEEKKEIEVAKEGVEEHYARRIPWWTSKRLCLSIVCFCGFFCLYAQRVNLSIAIVCMVKHGHSTNNGQTLDNSSSIYNISSNFTSNGTIYTHSEDETSTVIIRSTIKQCPVALSTSTLKGEFVWDKQLQGVILGAFFWGYTFLQIPGGWLAERFGPRLIISIGMLLVSTLTLLTPICARISPYLLTVCRVFIGVGEATMYPGAQVLWAKWSPPEERSRLVGFSFGGCQLGNALAFPIGSLLCAYGFDGGWPSIYYVLGAVSFVWCIVWIVFVRDSPEEMPGITDIEKKYILHSLGDDEDPDDQHHHKHTAKPWKSILTSGAMWAILIANACGNYGAYMLLTQMPTYMKEVLKFDIKSNGVFSMIPYLLFWVFIIIAGIFADFFIAREILSIGATRKLCCSIGMFVPAIFLVILGYMDCFKQTEAVVLLTLSMAFCGFQFSSFFINHGDIAPKFAGTLFGITNMGASVPGIIAPYVVGAITQNKKPKEWRIAFYIAAVVYCVGAVAYIILAKGEVQEWADINHKQGQKTELHEIQEEDQEHDEKSNNKV
ncbi:sialin-like isoform X1 [Mytilus galloprovincialis]|uniref:sialin-like isoform X1 n=1 Tax=Mytilus galloprovincialis TaxID=29158 RepID=UPI003F7C5EB5